MVRQTPRPGGRIALAAASVFLWFSGTAVAATKLLRFPDVWHDRIVFSYAGDLWTVGTEGGTAVRLTSNPGLELFAKFSPDGQRLAFTAQYGGDEQVYVMPAGGGAPRQLTFYPAAGPLADRWGFDNQVYGWTVDGAAVLFRSARDGYRLTHSRLYTVPAGGGAASPLPMPVSGAGHFSPDGKRIVYSPLWRDFRSEKRYQGGWANDLYIFDLAHPALVRVTEDPRTDRDPMWIGGAIYFNSDRSGVFNLYRYDVATGETRQLTQYRDWDVRWPSADADGQVVYELDGELHLYDTRSGLDRALSISVPSDASASRPQSVNAADNIESHAVSPGGERIAIVARGDVYSVPVEHGVTRNLTHSSNAHDREAAWSSDGRRLAYVSDRSGEEEIYVQAQDGGSAAQALTSGSHARYFAPRWSPDDKRLALADQTGRLYVFDVASKRRVEVAKDPLDLALDYQWSPDGQYLSYSLNAATGISSVCIWSAADGKARRVTPEYFNSQSPAWAPDGTLLYFLSSREYAPLISSTEFNFATDRQMGIFAIALQRGAKNPYGVLDDEPGDDDKDAAGEKDTDRKDRGTGTGKRKKNGQDAIEPKTNAGLEAKSQSGLEAKSHLGFEAKSQSEFEAKSHLGFEAKSQSEFEAKSQSGIEAKSEAGVNEDRDRGGDNTKWKRRDKANSKVSVKIDFDGIEQRAIRVPLEADDLTALHVTDENLIYQRNAGFYYGREAPAKPSVMAYSIKDREAKSVIEDVTAWSLTADGKHVLAQLSSKEIKYVEVGKSDEAKTVSLAGLVTTRIPSEEWHQIFAEVWRRYRDYFYVANMHGYDWQALRRKYEPLVDYVGHRADLNYVIAEMISELVVQHAYIEGGDLGLPKRPSVALPGARFELDAASGRYRIGKIFAGENEEERYRSPLTEVGVDVHAGDYVLSINGRDLAAGTDPYELLQAPANQPVEWRVSAAADGKDARVIRYRPLASEIDLLYLEWVGRNRARVDALSQGRLAYIHLPDMAEAGLREFIKWWYPQVRKEGLLVDVRDNTGGNISQMLIERLAQRLHGTDFARNHDAAGTYPGVVQLGPRVALVNETTASDGDIFAHAFREWGIGALIGKRTWGGVVGITDHGPLLDGGTVFVPEFGAADAGGHWIIEGHGVDPDIEVDQDPIEVLKGRDPQLERGVAALMQQLPATPTGLPERPAPPIKTGMP